MITVFGIRHHGAGCARSLRAPPSNSCNPIAYWWRGHRTPKPSCPSLPITLCSRLSPSSSTHRTILIRPSIIPSLSSHPNGRPSTMPNPTKSPHALWTCRKPSNSLNGTNPLHLAYPQPIKFFGTNPFLWCIHTHPAQRNEPNTICLQPDLHGTNPFAPRSRSHNHSAGTNPIIWPYPPPTLNDQERTQLSSLFHAHTHHEQERTHFPGTSLSTTLLNSLDQERSAMAWSARERDENRVK